MLVGIVSLVVNTINGRKDDTVVSPGIAGLDWDEKSIANDLKAVAGLELITSPSVPRALYSRHTTAAFIEGLSKLAFVTEKPAVLLSTKSYSLTLRIQFS